MAKQSTVDPLAFLNVDLSKPQPKQSVSVESILNTVPQPKPNHSFDLDSLLNAIKMPQVTQQQSPDVDQLPIGRNFGKQPALTSPVASDDELRRMYTMSLQNQNPPFSTDPLATDDEKRRYITQHLPDAHDDAPLIDNKGKRVPMKTTGAKSPFTGSRSVGNTAPEFDNENVVYQDMLHRALGRPQRQPASKPFQRVDMSPLERMLDVQESRNAVANNRQAPATIHDPNDRTLSPEETLALRNKEAADKLAMALGRSKLQEETSNNMSQESLARQTLKLQALKNMQDSAYQKDSNAIQLHGIDVNAALKQAELSQLKQQADKLGLTEGDIMKGISSIAEAKIKMGERVDIGQIAKELAGSLNKYKTYQAEPSTDAIAKYYNLLKATKKKEPSQTFYRPLGG